MERYKALVLVKLRANTPRTHDLYEQYVDTCVAANADQAMAIFERFVPSSWEFIEIKSVGGSWQDQWYRPGMLSNPTRGQLTSGKWTP